MLILLIHDVTVSDNLSSDTRGTLQPPRLGYGSATDYAVFLEPFSWCDFLNHNLAIATNDFHAMHGKSHCLTTFVAFCYA